MIRRIAILGLAAILPLVLTGDTSAYKYSGIRWSSPKMTYLINNSVSSWSSKLKAGTSTWTNSGSKFVFTYGGTTSTGASWTMYDSKHVMTKQKLEGAQWEGVLAVNGVWYDTSTKRIYDSDITFNTKYPWSTSGASNAYDVQNIGTHEQGHCLQLGDLYNSSDREKTMYGYGAMGETKKQTLHSDDIAGIKKIYGSK